MFDQSSTNATADFLTRESGAWNMAIRGVRVLYEPQGTAYTHQATGDVVTREERILGPLSLDNYVGEGDRVTLTYRNDTWEWRITNFRSRSLDGIEGYTQMEFEDYGDEHTDSDDESGSGSGSDDNWDIG